MSNGKNRVIREELERIYGKGCMFQKAYVADRIRQLGVSLTYGTFKKKYTLNQQKTLERRMTLHRNVLISLRCGICFWWMRIRSPKQKVS